MRKMSSIDWEHLVIAFLFLLGFSYLVYAAFFAPRNPNAMPEDANDDYDYEYQSTWHY